MIVGEYREKIARGELQADPAQQQAITHLQKLCRALDEPRRFWHGRRKMQGVYLYGPVGRGKSMLMDLFFKHLDEDKKQRLHFHHFMARVHQRLGQLQGQKNPLREVAKDWAKTTRVLCFDEFFVTDIGDAMILANLFDELFRQGVVLVATSNCAPGELYRNGLQRQRFLPTIDLLEQHCSVVSVEGELDHRWRHGRLYRHFSTDGDVQWLKEHMQAFEVALQSAGRLTLNNRAIPYQAKGQKSILFEFMALCGGPRSSRDYMVLADNFERLYLAKVPQMGAMEAADGAVMGVEDGYLRRSDGIKSCLLDDEARRFIALVDEFYDRGRLLVIAAEVDMTELYSGDRLAFEFQRTVSRLIEMQSWGA